MKRTVIALIASMAVATSVAGASPYDMQEGRWNVTLGMTGDASLVADVYEWGSFDMDTATSLYGSVVYGLTDKWGLEVGYNRYNCDDGNIDNYDISGTEWNVLYKISPYANLFVGYLDVDFDMHDWGGSLPTRSIGTHSVHAGIMGHYPLTSRVDAFARMALGTNSHTYEIGMAYEFVPRWSLNVSYYDAQYRDFDYYGVKNSVDADGVRLGISTSF